METSETIELLREIRDLQKAHLESYAVALKNQQASIEQQQQAVLVQGKAAQLQRRALLGLLIFAILVLVVLCISFVRH